ncbi:MAG: RNA 2',3'-cyclic phosphodiesterase [Bacillota bacterium]
MRLFICIDLEEGQLKEIEKIIGKLKADSRKGRFSKPEHNHLTLNFLGDVEDERLQDVEDAIRSISFGEFSLNMSGLGWFHKRSGKIYWIGFERNEELLKLQERLHRELKDRGFKLEKREYTPHITLGRDVRVGEDFDPSSYTKMIYGMSIRVKEIVLKKSENHEGRTVHTRLFSKSAR